MHPLPSPTALWLRAGSRAELRDLIGHVLERAPSTALEAAFDGRDHYLGLFPVPADDPQFATFARQRAVSAAPANSRPLDVLDLCVEDRPVPAPTPPPAALLASGDAVIALARTLAPLAGDPRDLSVRTFGRGRAAYALVDRIASLPASLLRRPDVTRLWSPAPGVYCACGFEPAVPAAALARALAPAEIVVLRPRGGSFRARPSPPLAAGVPLVAVEPPRAEIATPPGHLVRLRFGPATAPPPPVRGLLVEGASDPTFRRWLRRAPSPLLGGLRVYRDRHFWLVDRPTTAFIPPVGTPLAEIESLGRRVLLPRALEIRPRLPAATLCDALGVRAAEPVLVRPAPDRYVVAIVIPERCFLPLDRRIAREAP